MKFKMVGVLLLLLFPVGIIAQEEITEVIQFTLEEAQNYALEHSYESQKAMQDVYYAQKQVWEATAIGLPQVNAAADYSYNIQNPAQPFPGSIIPEDLRPPGFDPSENVLLAFGARQSLGGSVSASQMIFDGAYFVGLQSSKTVAAIAELAHNKTDILVKEAVANAYAGVLVADETHVIIERNIANIQDNVDETSALYDNGLAEEQDVLQLKLTLSSLENLKNRNERMRKINREMLKFTMGMDINRPIELTQSINEILLSSYQVTALEEALDLEEHIDYQISANTMKTDELLLKYEKTKYMPNISAFFNAGYNSYSEIFDFFEFQDEKWAPVAMVGLKIDIPIFSSFQRKARVDMARIDLEKSQTSHEQTVQNLFMELHTSQDAYAYSIDNFKTSKANMELAENIERKESIKYQEGISTSLDLANAQRQLYQNQEDYLNAILLVVQSKLALDKALNKL